jgi:O-antigen/teichoic acid export membrane protein
MKFKLLAKMTIPGVIIGSTIGVILAFKQFGVWSLVYSYLIQTLITTIMLWSLSDWKPSILFNTHKFKKHFLYGYKLTLSSILDVVFTNIYQIVIGRLYLPQQVGFYTRANSLMMLPVSNISTALNKVAFPLFSDIQNDIERLRHIYRKIMMMIIFIVCPIITMMSFLCKPLVIFLFTDKWLPIVPIFQIISITGILYPLHLYNLLILQVKGRSDLFF